MCLIVQQGSVGNCLFITILCLSDITVPATKSNRVPLKLWLGDVLLVFRYEHFSWPVSGEYRPMCGSYLFFFYFF